MREDIDTEELALTKTSERLMARVTPFITRGLGGAIVGDNSSTVDFEVLEVSRRDWESSKVNIAGCNGEVWEGIETEFAASSLAGGGLCGELCGVTADDTSSKGQLFDA